MNKHHTSGCWGKLGVLGTEEECLSRGGLRGSHQGGLAVFKPLLLFSGFFPVTPPFFPFSSGIHETSY